MAVLMHAATVYAVYFARVYFREFRKSGATHEINNARKNIYLRSRRMNATCTHSARARRMILLVLYWLLRSLLSSIANLTTRENVLKFWFAKNETHEIYDVYSIWSPTWIYNKTECVLPITDGMIDGM